MQVLELSDGDTRILRRAIEARLREMRDELAHTDDRAYRDALRTDLDRLEAIGRAVGAAVIPEVQFQ